MKNFSFIKVFLLQIYFILTFITIAVVMSLGGLVAKLSLDAVIQGWEDLIADGVFFEMLRIIWFVLTIMGIPFSQGIISDKSVKGIKKLFSK